MIEHIADLQHKIVSGEISATEITLDILRKIKSSDLNCFITVLDAEEQAERIDKMVASGFKGRLAGVPVAIKDNMRYKGFATTCGSKILFGSDDEDCEVVKRLKAEGAIIVGKTNMDEFAMGSSNTTSAYGAVLNPLDKTRVPGGSSGGSAAAVAAGLCRAALGSDTGGSIRQPASYCGVVGLKPTIGSIDGRGMYALSQDMDQIGPITANVDDNKLMFEVTSGKKVDDISCRGIRVGLVGQFDELLTADTRKVVESAKRIFGANDCGLVELDMPSVKAASAVYCILGNAQANINLRGIGTKDERGEKLGAEVKKRIIIGEYALHHPEITEAARKVRDRIKREFEAAFELCDIIISPSAPSTAFEFTADRKRNEIVFSDVFTQPPSIAGLPAISVPCVKASDGLPIGLQIISRYYREDLIFAAAKLIEKSV